MELGPVERPGRSASLKGHPMHIRFNRSLRGDYGRARVGDVKMVEAAVGKSLVQRGLAAEVEAPSEDDAAKFDGQIDALRGKTADEVKDAHSGPGLHALLAHLKVNIAKNASKADLAAALVGELSKPAEA